MSAPCRQGAGEEVGQRLLAVAGYARNGDDLAGGDRQRDLGQQPDPPVVPRDDAIELDARRAHGPRLAVRQHDGVTDHQLGELGFRRRRRCARGDEATGTQHRDAVRDGEHLVELVADEHDRQAVGDEMAQRGEQARRLLRRQHRRGLVEDQHLGAAVERLQDLDALALADRKPAHARIGLGGEPELPRQRDDARARSPPAGERAPQRLGAQDDVVQHRQVVGQREVLVDDADAGGERRARVAGRQRRAERGDAAGVGDVVAEQDRHQRRLAGAVLAEQRQHLAARERERDRIVGDQVAEALADAGELEDHRRAGAARRFRFHPSAPRRPAATASTSARCRRP